MESLQGAATESLSLVRTELSFVLPMSWAASEKEIEAMSEVKEGQQAELLPARKVLCPVPCGGFNLEHADYCNWCGRQLRQHKAPATAPPSVTSEVHAECGIAHDEDVDCDEAKGIMVGLEDISAGRTKPLEQIEREMSTGHNALPPSSAVVREALEQIAAMTCSCHDANNEGWHSQHCAKRIALQGLAALPAPGQREAQRSCDASHVETEGVGEMATLPSGRLPSVQALPRGKVGWMDSMDFDHELGLAGTNEIHCSEEACRKEHQCIDMSEKEPDPHGYNCSPLKVIVFRADEAQSVITRLVELRDAWRHEQEHTLVPFAPRIYKRLADQLTELLEGKVQP